MRVQCESRSQVPLLTLSDEDMVMTVSDDSSSFDAVSTSPVLLGMARSLQNVVSADLFDESVSSISGSVDDGRDMTRAFMVLDWLIRQVLPELVCLTPGRHGFMAVLRSVPPVVDLVSVRHARDLVMHAAFFLDLNAVDGWRLAPITLDMRRVILASLTSIYASRPRCEATTWEAALFVTRLCDHILTVHASELAIREVLDLPPSREDTNFVEVATDCFRTSATDLWCSLITVGETAEGV